MRYSNEGNNISRARADNEIRQCLHRVSGVFTVKSDKIESGIRHYLDQSWGTNITNHRSDHNPALVEDLFQMIWPQCTYSFLNQFEQRFFGLQPLPAK
jgi:hypothetical protein